MFLTIINGPNLNLTGKREPAIYGSENFNKTFSEIEELCARHRVSLRTMQSNHEGDLIDTVQEAGFDSDCLGIIINPGALAHYSYALADAMAAVPAKIIEVHISNIHSREPFRQTSVTASASDGMICGLGLKGYNLAARTILEEASGC